MSLPLKIVSFLSFYCVLIDIVSPLVGCQVELDLELKQILDA